MKSSFVICISDETARVILHIFLTHLHQTISSLTERTHHEEHLALCIQSRTPLVLIVLT